MFVTASPRLRGGRLFSHVGDGRQQCGQVAIRLDSEQSGTEGA